MLDDIGKWIDGLWAMGMHSPDLTAMALGSLFAFALTLGFEFFLPTVLDADAKRRQKGYTFLFWWIVGSIASSALWYAWDGLDPPRLRWTVCIVVSALTFFAYPVLARVLTTKFPAIGTAWTAAT